MADYRSTLTGTQMDSALLDMAEHNSEAYAVGERNGIAVASDDVTYHNNARYYAQIASSQIVGDASSAVRWDTDQSEALTSAQKAVARNNINAASDSDVVKITSQTLTSAEQAQARANIAAGGSNPNLLDNPWFTNPVNQLGLTTYSGSGLLKTIDRWFLLNGSGTNSLTVQNGYLSVRSDGNGFAQAIEPAMGAALNGKTLTCSVLFRDGTIKSATGVYNNAALVSIGNGFYLGLNGGKQTIFNYITGNGVTKDIVACKTELGSVSTLANDTPPKESQEADDCKLYFQRIQQEDGYTAPVGFGIVAASTNILRTLIPLSSHLRKAGTLTATATNIGQMRVQGNGSNLTPTAITGRGVLNGHAVVDITVNGTLANNQFYTLVFANSTAIIDLSKDL